MKKIIILTLFVILTASSAYATETMSLFLPSSQIKDSESLVLSPRFYNTKKRRITKDLSSSSLNLYSDASCSSIVSSHSPSSLSSSSLSFGSLSSGSYYIQLSSGGLTSSCLGQIQILSTSPVFEKISLERKSHLSNFALQVRWENLQGELAVSSSDKIKISIHPSSFCNKRFSGTRLSILSPKNGLQSINITRPNFPTVYVCAVSGTKKASILIPEFNHAPTASAQPVSAIEDTSKELTLSATDADGELLAYSIVSAPNHGTLSGSGSSRTYTPYLNYNGLDSFSFKANDGIIDSETVTVPITVNSVNDSPVSFNDSISGAIAGSPLSIPKSTLLSNDYDVDNSIPYSPNYGLTVLSVSDPSTGTVSISGDNINFTPALTFNGTAIFSYSISDGSLSSSATVSVSVSCSSDYHNVSGTCVINNRAPIASAQSVSTDEDTAKDIALSATDSDGDSLTYLISSNPSHGTLSGTAPNITYTPELNYYGIDNFEFKANDQSIDSEPVTVSIAVNPVNDQPTLSEPSNVTILEDAGTQIVNLSGITSGSYNESETLTVSAVSNNPAVVPNPIVSYVSQNSIGSMSFTPVANANGFAIISVTVDDGQSVKNLISKEFTVTVSAVNDAPIAVNDSISGFATAGSSFFISSSLLLSNDSDIDNTVPFSQNNGLSIISVSDPSTGSVYISGNDVIFTPPLSFNGTATFLYSISDGSLTSSATVSVPVSCSTNYHNVSGYCVQDFNISYNNQNTFYTNTQIDSLIPTIIGGGETKVFSVSPSLPAGLIFNINDGTISGTPQTVSIPQTYTVTATSGSETVSYNLGIEIRDSTIQLSPMLTVINPQNTNKIDLIAQGGSGSFYYSVESGSGSITPSLGEYSISNKTREVVSVRATDNITNKYEVASIYKIAARFNGSVSKILINTEGAKTYGYFGGAFSSYSPYLMNGLGSINLSSGEISSGCNLAGLLNPDAVVMSILSTDTHLFIGGRFSSYAGTPVGNIIKINKNNCSMDIGFSRSTGFNNQVNSLAISEGFLYVGGAFNAYNSETALRLAKLDLTTGDLDTSFTQSTGFDGTVNSIAVSGSSLYVGGLFLTYKGFVTRSLAKLDLTTGNLDGTFIQSTGFNNQVSALAVSGGSLYVGGDFTSYRGTNAQRLAKLSLTTGSLDTAFTQSAGFNSSVFALTVFGSSVFVGGSFSTYRGATAPLLAKLDLTTGNLDSTFTQSTGFNNKVSALAVSGGALYAGGAFNSYRGTNAQRLAKLDLTTGDLDTTFTQSTGFNNQVNSIAAHGSSLYVGGQFSTYRGTHVLGLAKVDLTTGELDPSFTQTTTFSVSALAVSGNSLYVGGLFTSYRGTTIQNIAKLDLTTGNLDTAFTKSTGFDNQVSALAISGSSLYAGGAFTSYRGFTAKYLAKVDLITGNLDTTFTQSTGFDNQVSALAVSGSAIYVGGLSFTSYRLQSGTTYNTGGGPSQRLAKLDLTTGNLDSTFTQSTGFNSSVSSLVVSGSALYAGGAFALYRATPAQRLAKLDLITGNLDPIFNQNGGFSSNVNSILISGNFIYAGGGFTSYRGFTAKSLAKVDLITGNLDTTFTQSVGFNSAVNTIAISGNFLYVGGQFSSYRGADTINSCPNFSILDIISGNLSD